MSAEEEHPVQAVPVTSNVNHIRDDVNDLFNASPIAAFTAR